MVRANEYYAYYAMSENADPFWNGTSQRQQLRFGRARALCDVRAYALRVHRRRGAQFGLCVCVRVRRIGDRECDAVFEGGRGGGDGDGVGNEGYYGV